MVKDTRTRWPSSVWGCVSLMMKFGLSESYPVIPGMARVSCIFFCKSHFGGVSHVRSEGQIIVSLSLSEDLVREVDAIRGGLSRSAFMREAVAALLKSKGKAVPESILRAPDRAGKPRKKRASAASSLLASVLSEQPATYSTKRDSSAIDAGSQ